MRKLFFLLITICGVMLTGCAQLIDLTDKESDVLAEYMAGTMLRYAGDYEEALIYPELPQADNAGIPQTTRVDLSPENTAVPLNLSAKSQYGTIVSLAGMFNDIFKNTFSITYQNYKAYDSYPDGNDLFTIEPAEGKKLIVFTFNVKNITKKSQKLDLMKYNISYQLTDNNSSVYYPMMTLLNNDIQYINLGINAGKSSKAVILFELPENIDVSHLLLTLTYEDKTTFLDISQ